MTDYTWRAMRCGNPNKAWVRAVDGRKLSALMSAKAAHDLCVAHNMIVGYLDHRIIAGGWKDIATAPRDGTVFLAVNSRGDGLKPPNPYFLCFSTQSEDGRLFAAEAGWRTPGRDWPAYPTLWHPLPELPGVES